MDLPKLSDYLLRYRRQCECAVTVLMWWNVLLATIMVLDSAHLLSPLLLAWSRRELRSIVLREWRRHIAMPGIVMIGVLIAPPAQLFGFYWAWNAYHFGMQNFGLLQLNRQGVSPDRRIYEGLICLAVAGVGIGALPSFFPQTSLAGLLIILAFSFDHWLCDIALSSRAVRWQWAFIAAVLTFGGVWFLLRQGPLSVKIVPQIVAIRIGMGMIHFIYSARIWKFSDPRVRSAIGGAYGY